jgi:hypothetical protein
MMRNQYRHGWLSALVVGLAWLVPALPVQADVIVNSISGAHIGGHLQDGPSAFIETGGIVGVFGHPMFGFAASNLRIDVSGFNTNPGPVLVTNPATGQAEFIITSNTNPSQFARFTITNPAELALESGDNVTAHVVLASENLDNIDLSPFLNGGVLELTLQASDLSITPGSPGTANVTLVTGNNGGTSSFSLYANDSPVPEPTSLVLFGGLGVVGVWYAKRRFGAAKA